MVPPAQIPPAVLSAEEVAALVAAAVLRPPVLVYIGGLGDVAEAVTNTPARWPVYRNYDHAGRRWLRVEENQP